MTRNHTTTVPHMIVSHDVGDGKASVQIQLFAPHSQEFPAEIRVVGPAGRMIDIITADELMDFVRSRGRQL